MKIKNIPEYIKMNIQNYSRHFFILPKQRKTLFNTDFSIIASTCNGGVLYSDMGIRFNSPTINVWLYPEDYLRMVSDLKKYMSCELLEIVDDTVNYPVGELNGDVRIYFQHYHTFNEAKQKWETRKSRLNYNNLFLMFTDRNGCTDEQLKQFDKLPYKNKLVFTCKKHPELKSAVWCKEYENFDEVPILTLYRNLRGERLYDRYFNFVEWLNNGYKGFDYRSDI